MRLALLFAQAVSLTSSFVVPRGFSSQHDVQGLSRLTMVGGFSSTARKAGTKTKRKPQLDPASKLRRSSDLYDQLVANPPDYDDEKEEEFTLTDYVVAVRAPPHAQLSDWVPVACLALLCPTLHDPTRVCASYALPYTRSEVWECACQVLPSLRKLDRSGVEYAFEPTDSWETHVFEKLDKDASMEAQALKTLGLHTGATATEIRSAHRRLARENHPDLQDAGRVAAATAVIREEIGGMEVVQMRQELDSLGVPHTGLLEKSEFIGLLVESRGDPLKARFSAIQDAYQQLGGGREPTNRSESWYANLGGKARVEFSGSVADMRKTAVVKAELSKSSPTSHGGGWEAAVCPLDYDIVNDVMQRNVVRKMQLK